MAIQILVIKEIGPSLNQFYAGMHWSARKKIKDRWHYLTMEAVRNQGIIPVKSYPISMDCRFVFGKGATRYDWENCAASAKMIQDGLVSEGIIENDSPRYIIGGRIWCVRGKESKTMIAIKEGKDVGNFT